MAFLQAGPRESRKTRSRSPYSRPSVRESHEGRYTSLLDRPIPPTSMSIMDLESQDQHVQDKFSVPSVHTSSSTSNSNSGLSSMSRSRSGSVSVSGVGLFIWHNVTLLQLTNRLFVADCMLAIPGACLQKFRITGTISKKS